MKLAQTFLNLAFSITPHKDRVWLEDMRYEAAFIQHPLTWSLSALSLALRWRLAHILQTPSQIAFASVTVAAIATMVIVPNLLRSKTAPVTTALPSSTAASQETAADAYIDPSVSRYAEAQDVPAENPQADAGFSEPLPPTLPAATPAISDATLSEPVPPTLPSGAEFAPLSENPPETSEDIVLGAIESAQTNSSTETATASESEMPENEMGVSTPSPDAAIESGETDIEAMIEAALEQDKEVRVLELNTSSVRLKINQEVTLEVYQGTSTSDKLLFSGTSSNATLTYDLPIFIKTSDGSAIELIWGEGSSTTLGAGQSERLIQSAQ